MPQRPLALQGARYPRVWRASGTAAVIDGAVGSAADCSSSGSVLQIGILPCSVPSLFVPLSSSHLIFPPQPPAALLLHPPDESHPPCPIGRSSPCHPLHREPCDSAFGTSLESRLAATGAQLLGVSPTAWPLYSFFLFPLLALFFVLWLHVLSSFASPSLFSRRGAQSPTHQRLTRRLSAAPVLLLASCTATTFWAVDANSAGFLCLLAFALLLLCFALSPQIGRMVILGPLASSIIHRRLAIHEPAAPQSRLLDSHQLHEAIEPSTIYLSTIMQSGPCLNHAAAT
ncbi:hypothetical protein TARUN_7834 [Trichoderma arundinaceum]|uniref:Uncharacterized protein n=1 Tax=Trichoderma arundinaceum TaxID=490622 RepID=A0A395NEM4_TRIAR|nr:hypothetical protein TARUN_7834 [Trichoderma arundinaceum]